MTSTPALGIGDHPIIEGWNVADRAVRRGVARVWQDGILSLHNVPGKPNCFGVSFEGVADFEIDSAARDIAIDRRFSPSAETVRHLLLDQIWPRILAHDGKLVLHAAGVAFGREAILIVGGSGAGKSTLAASLHRAGHVMMGDDAMIVSNRGDGVRARAHYASLRLFPDSVDEILGDAAELSPVADYTSKWNVTAIGGENRDGEAPVRAIFVIGGTTPDVQCERIEGAAAAVALVEQSFTLDPTDVIRARRRLEQASAVARQVPVFTLTYARDFTQLPQVHRVIENVVE